MARILVIEDDDLVQQLLLEGLTKAGYEVTLASDGEEGIRRFREQPADLIITDILMPVKDGVEAIRELRHDFPDAKIIAITGVRGRFSRLPAAEYLGAVRTFVKPFSLQEIIGAVKQILGGDTSEEVGERRAGRTA